MWASSAHQVLHNRESSALQYAMRDRLTALGWSEIEVIDDDLGRSVTGGVQRAGFERMVAEVCLGKVGAVCAREVSRFARNGRLQNSACKPVNQEERFNNFTLLNFNQYEITDAQMRSWLDARTSIMWRSVRCRFASRSYV
jgi:DNA invertase Pin-like site-specific DNA recombinase